MLYLDTSALLPYYRAEAYSGAVERFLGRQTEPLTISPLTRVEVASALARWVRHGELDEQAANRVKNAFHEDIASHRLEIRAIRAQAYERATEWLLARRTALRSLDALHLACAEQAGAALVTFDDTFAEAAESLGVTAIHLG